MLCVFLRWFTFVKTWVISLTNSCFWYIHLGGDYHFEGENVISEILMTDADALVLPSKIQGPFCKNDSEYNCTCRWWFPRRLLISRSPTHLIHTRTAHQVAQLLLISVPSISASRAAFTQPQSSPWIPFKLTLLFSCADSVLLKLFGCHSCTLWVFCHFLMRGCVCCQEEFTGTLPGAGSCIAPSFCRLQWNFPTTLIIPSPWYCSLK